MGDDQELKPTSLLDLLLLSEVYEGNVTRITNELVIGMIAATETSRNTTIFTLSQITKKPEYRIKIREEIKACLDKYNLSST